MAGARTYEDLDVWKKAHQLVLKDYELTKRFPRDELFGLRAQIRRSAASVPANIAEGFRKPTKADKARFYYIALGSLDETRYHLLLAHDLGYGNTLSLRAEVDEVARMLDSYIHAIIASDKRRTYGLGGLLVAGATVAFYLLASGF